MFGLPLRTLGPVATLALLLLLPDSVLAQAGGGSSGFGGGGGGGGGGSGGSGGGSGDGDSGGSFLLFALLVVGSFLWSVLGTMYYRRRVRRRGERVRTAAAEAAEDDAWFAPDQVERDARELFVEAQGAWDRRDRGRLSQLIGKDLFVEWERRLDDFERKGWHNRVEVVGAPTIGYVGLTNREDDTQDRATVLINAKLRSHVVDRGGNKIMRSGESDEEIEVHEYWTLMRHDDRWLLASIEQKDEGTHHLSSEIVASPSSDGRLRDETVTELASADALPEGFTTADLADFDFEGDGRARALDLSVADGRFAPDVLEGAARRAVAAWAEAVDGDDAALEAVAHPDATRKLLYGGDDTGRTRLVVRGPRIRQVRITNVDVEHTPATMRVEVELGGRRYLEDRDTAAVLSGNKDRATTFTERWTLALDGSAEAPWQLTGGRPESVTTS